MRGEFTPRGFEPGSPSSRDIAVIGKPSETYANE